LRDKIKSFLIIVKLSQNLVHSTKLCIFDTFFYVDFFDFAARNDFDALNMSNSYFIMALNTFFILIQIQI